MTSLIKRLTGKEAGVTLIETLIALAIIGFIAVAILSSMATGAKATTIAGEQAFAESLARSELEYIKNQPYDSIAPLEYGVDPELRQHEPEGWVILPPTVSTVHDGNIQKIAVTVTRNGKAVLSVTTYKVNR